jgi:hypothetical protein
MYVVLRDAGSHQMRGLPDPSGGTFDAAGDYDRFFDDSYPGYDERLDLPRMRSVDPYGDTEMAAAAMPSLLRDIANVIPHAREGSELRGLWRLRVMAEQCAAQSGASLVWFGD